MNSQDVIDNDPCLLADLVLAEVSRLIERHIGNIGATPKDCDAD